MRPLDADLLLAIAPRFEGAARAAQERIAAEVGPHLERVLAAHGITGPLRVAHFLAQVTHECAHFRTMVEFASGAAYEGRADLGNTEAGDGMRYKGRGLIQLTGRHNYREMGARLGLDLEGAPDRAADPAVSLEIACAYWSDRGINAACDRDDLLAATRAVNGGFNGLEDRRACLGRARAALGA